MNKTLSAAVKPLKEKSVRVFTCGDEEIDRLYREVRDVIAEQDILRIYSKLSDEKTVRITICNLWRLSKNKKTYRIICEKRDVFSNVWSSCPVFDFRLLPLVLGEGQNIWKTFLKKAIHEIILQHGYCPSKVSDGWSVSKTAEFLYARYVDTTRRIKGADGLWTNGPKEKGRIDDIHSKLASRALVKNIWNEMIDRDTLKLVAKVKGFKCPIDLSDYVELSSEKKAMERVFNERPNLMPLLSNISLKAWKRPDLFSRDLWCGKNGNPAEIAKISNVLGFQSRGQAKWLFSQKTSVVRYLASAMRMDTNHISKLMRVEFEKNTPAIIITFVHWSLGEFSSTAHYREMYPDKNDEYIQSQSVMFGKKVKDHLVNMWKANSFKAMTSRLGALRAEISGALDWLSDEGTGNGNFSKSVTLTEMLRRSTVWHATIYQRRREERKNEGPAIWKELLAPFCIDNYIIKNISNSLDLDEEGFIQQHCVGSYEYTCLNGKYAVFSMKCQDDLDFTLGLRVDISQNGYQPWIIDQCQGKGNSSPTKKVMEIAKEVTNILNQSMRVEYEKK